MWCSDATNPQTSVQSRLITCLAPATFPSLSHSQCTTSGHVSPAILPSMSYSLSTALWCCHVCTSILNGVFSAHLTAFMITTVLDSVVIRSKMPTGMPVQFIWSYPTTLRRLTWTGLSYDRHQLVATLMRHRLQPRHSRSLEAGAGITKTLEFSMLAQELEVIHTPSGEKCLLRTRPTLPMCCRLHACVSAQQGAPLSILYSGRPMSMLQCTDESVMYSQPSVSFVLAILRLCQGIQACRACHQPNSDCLHRSNL